MVRFIVVRVPTNYFPHTTQFIDAIVSWGHESWRRVEPFGGEITNIWFMQAMQYQENISPWFVPSRIIFLTQHNLLTQLIRGDTNHGEEKVECLISHL